MLAALTNRSPVTGDALPRAARLHAVAGHERHLFGELSPPWWSGPFAINILLFTTEIKQFIPFSPPGNCSYELKITFCVRGVVSPILANLFLHYAFDVWMTRTHPNLPWCRYADDGLVHCRSEQEAEALKAKLQARLAECRLEMHPTKTKVVYCKDGNRRGKHSNVKFDFLGYCFRPRLVRRFRDNAMFCGFNPAVSASAMKAMREAIRDLDLRCQTQLSLQDIACQLNPLLRGWIGYYGRYAPSALYPLLRYVNHTLVAWAMRKFKRFKGCKILAGRFFERLAKERPDLFVHWQNGMVGVFA